jgi:peptide/nickel transport system permease protein
MTNFILKKIAYSFSIILGVITISFLLMYVLPGDPVKMILGQRADKESVEIVKNEMGLNRPVLYRYLNYTIKTFSGDFGKSYITNRNVLTSIIEKIPATILLSLTAIILASLIGVLMGTLAGIYRNTFFDKILIFISLIGISIPQFVLGLISVFIFGVIFKLLPLSGYINEGWIYIILPSLTLALRPLAIIARITRSSVIDTKYQDFVKTAYSKGLSKSQVLVKHILRNSLNPVVTTISSSFAATLAGVFFIEYIFNWPGIGLLTIQSIMKLDFPMIQGVVLFSAIVFVVINLFVDIVYAFLDPRVKLREV